MTRPHEAWVFRGMAGKRIGTVIKKTPEALPPRALRGPFSRLTWLSLVGVHPCRAQLRFARQHSSILRIAFWFKIDKSAYRVSRFKTVKSAYRLAAKKQVGWTLDKLESLV
jgi:hypothetical protein